MNRVDVIRTLRLAFIGEHTNRKLLEQSQVDKALDEVQAMTHDEAEQLMAEVLLGVPEGIRPRMGEGNGTTTSQSGQALQALPGGSVRV